MPNRTCGECKECFVTVVCGFSGERVDACKPDCACDRFIASPAGEIIESLGIKMTNNQQRFSAESYAGSGRCCPACWNDMSLTCPEWLVAKATQIVEERDRLRDEAKSNERRLVNYVDDIAAREESCATYRAEVERLRDEATKAKVRAESVLPLRAEVERLRILNRLLRSAAIALLVQLDMAGYESPAKAAFRRALVETAGMGGEG